ncbi:unnamed protein product [Prunus armeniaca]
MEEAKTERFSDIVFSWSLEDIFNENLYKNQVEKIPESFHSVWQYFGSYIHPLLEETRAQVHSSMETIDRAPFAKVVGFAECNPHGVGAYRKNVYDIKVDCWRNRLSDRGKEPYKTLPGDLFVLADAKPKTVSDLQRVGRSWAFVSVTNVSENENEDDTTSLYFKVKASREFEVKDSTHTSLFLVFLVNLIPNGRIWKALRMSGNQKIIKEVLCTNSMAQKNNYLCSEPIDGSLDKWLVESSSSGLNESQTGAVLACLEMLHCDSKSTVQLIWGPPGTGKTKTTATLLFTLLQMNCRTVICAPTNVAITEVASRFLEIVTKAESKSLFCSLGEVLLFGNKERLKVGAHIEDIYLNYRVKKLGECLGPVTGWRSCFASMIDFLEDCVSHYHVFLKNELTEEKECRSDTELIKGKCKSFLEFFRDRFVSTALPLRYCISTLCTHLAKNYISEHNFQNMISLICLVEAIELLLVQDNVVSEELELLCSRSKFENVAESSFVDNTFLLGIKIRKCLSVLRTLQDSLSGLHLPNVRNEESLMEFCFQRASLIFCTVSSSYKLHRVEMEPLTIAVIDDAAQLKECESTITLQLPGVKHAVLVGDECQLPATVKSNVSNEAGFSRSLFERLSSMGHSKHLLNMQYRMHPSISFFPNSNFYNNQILDAPVVKKRSHEKHYLPGSMFGPFSFINVIGGMEEKNEDGHSPKNLVEVSIILELLQNLYKEWMVSKKKLSIGVVSPYAAQVVAVQDKLRQKYEKIYGFTVKVRTVEGFQGGEEDVIIMSTVRSNSLQSLDFISQPQRVNVALTRARHCLWILGHERTLLDSESVWKALVLDAKSRQCFFNADEDKNLAKAILGVKKEFDQFDDLLNADSILFRSSRWKVLFSDNFLKSFKMLKSIRLKKSVLNLLLKLSSGWRPKNRNVGIICGSSPPILRQYKFEGLYIVCTTDIEKDVKYVQILKIWDILPLQDIPKLVNRLESILKRYTDDFINRCNEKCLEGDLEVPKSWPLSLDVPRFKDLSITENQSDLVGDDDSDGRNYVENSQVSESLLLMKFYSLSSGVVNHLLSDRQGRELDLPFEVTDQEMEIMLYHRSSFIVGRSGTGKTTVLTTKLFQNEQCHQLAVQGCHSSQNSINQSSSATMERTLLRQLFVTVSPKLCFAIKKHVLHLKSFACGGGSDSTERSLIDMADFDEDEAQFKDIKDSFHDIPPNSYPLVITFHKFLMMLDGTPSAEMRETNSYFERFLDATKLTHGQLQSSRSVALETFIRTKEVTYERFSSSYWPHFNIQLTKKLDASRVFTEIISHIKGGLGSIEAGDGKLKRKDYVQLSEGRTSNLSKQKREEIYDIFQAYEKMKMENGDFDLADFVIDLHRRLRHEKYGGDQMDFVYIDEVQDLTISQIALFKHMCSNVEEGFIFSGDTAQTIARGIDFRFQDIRHLFHNKFVLESRSNKLEERKEKGQISKMFHLTQNFRTHTGVLKLSQSIVEVIYHFFPHYIDVLKPETSLIYGEAPVLLEYGENENAIIKLFGNSETGSGNIVGFGAEQVILVRDDAARKEVSMFVGKHALVLTIVECKGLEFMDVLLYNFFGSSPLKNQWRVIYDYMKEEDLLDPALPQRFPSFNEAKHNILCSELKQLYVAVTRTRQRLWICENVEELSKPMFDYWKKKCLVQVRQLDDSLAQAMQVASSPEEWKSQGIKLYHEHNYEMAIICFQRAGDTYWERSSKAANLKAMADRMRTSNPDKANSILREAAEIFDALGKADSAARCFSDLGDYERAARIYLDKGGMSDLERAAECFSLAGCYKDAADAYAKGNFFSECLTVCAKGKLFEMGLQYINYWKQHATEDCVVARRDEGIDKIEQEFLESCALHYYELKDNRSMMKFVNAFDSIILMRNFLKKLDILDELLLLEEEHGNYLEAAEIAKLKGDILLEADFLEKAGKSREASLHILFYVLANSLWSNGRKGWPIQHISQKEELLSKAKSFAKNKTESFYELVCTEVDILLNEQSDLALIKNHMSVCQRHKSIRGELLSARKILDAHISSSSNKYVWETKLVDDDDLMKCSENQVSIDSLIYFWNFWKDKIALIIEYLGCLETQDVNEYKSYGDLCFDYLGVWRLYHNLSPVYVLLISDADWIRGLDKRCFKKHGKLVSVDVHQLVSAARKYWSSEMLSVGMKVLDKLENLYYKFPKENADPVFCQSRCLTHICEVSVYLLQSKCLKLRDQDTERLQRLVKFSTESVVTNIFPMDWRSSLKENMISLRRTDALKNALEQVIVEYTSSETELSFGQIGRLVMVILGSGKLNSELYEKLVEKLDCHQPWEEFIKNLCGNIGPGNSSQEPREVSVMLKFCDALVDTYNVNWRVVNDYISPGCFLYLVERLVIWATCFKGYAITTSSCFIEWLIYQEEDADVSSIVADVQPSLVAILYVVRECVFNKRNMVDWIKKTNENWKNYYSQLILRFVVVLCLVYVNFGTGQDILYDLLGRDYITEQLPWEFYDALKRRRIHKSFSINVSVLAAAFQKIGNTLVIASFGSDCSRFLCSDAIFVDMKANRSRDDILRKLFPKPHVLQASQDTSVESGANSSKILPSNSDVVEPFETGDASDKPSDAGGVASHSIGEKHCTDMPSTATSKPQPISSSASQPKASDTQIPSNPEPKETVPDPNAEKADASASSVQGTEASNQVAISPQSSSQKLVIDETISTSPIDKESHTVIDTTPQSEVLETQVASTSEKTNVDELGVREEEMAGQTEDTGSVPPKEEEVSSSTMTQQIVISEKTSVRTEEELGHSEQELPSVENLPLQAENIEMEAVEHLIKPRLSVVQPSKAFDPIIEMVWMANASHLNLKVPEGTVGQIGPIDTQPSPSHVEGSDEQATENEPYVASAPIQETCGSASSAPALDVPPINATTHGPANPPMTYVIKDYDDLNPDSQAQNNLTRLSKLKQSIESSSSNTQSSVIQAKTFMMEWMTRSFDDVRSYGVMSEVHQALNVLAQSDHKLYEILCFAMDQLEQLRDALSQYHDSLDLASNAEYTVSRFQQSYTDRDEAIADGESKATEIQKVDAEIKGLETALQHAKKRRTQLAQEINEQLGRAETQDKVVKTLESKILTFKLAIRRPAMLLKEAEFKFQNCLEILRDIFY